MKIQKEIYELFKEVTYCQEFEKDFKKLLKRFPSLEEDLNVLLKAQIALYHKLNIDNKGIVRISNLGISTPDIYKVRKFACKSLKGSGANTGLRLIYAYFEKEDRLELIEIYFKGNKAKENRKRIYKYFKRDDY